MHVFTTIPCIRSQAHIHRWSAGGRVFYYRSVCLGVLRLQVVSFNLLLYMPWTSQSSEKGRIRMPTWWDLEGGALVAELRWSVGGGQVVRVGAMSNI